MILNLEDLMQWGGPNQNTGCCAYGTKLNKQHAQNKKENQHFWMLVVLGLHWKMSCACQQPLKSGWTRQEKHNAAPHQLLIISARQPWSLGLLFEQRWANWFESFWIFRSCHGLLLCWLSVFSLEWKVTHEDWVRPIGCCLGMVPGVGHPFKTNSFGGSLGPGWLTLLKAIHLENPWLKANPPF